MSSGYRTVRGQFWRTDSVLDLGVILAGAHADYVDTDHVVQVRCRRNGEGDTEWEVLALDGLSLVPDGLIGKAMLERGLP